MKRMVRWAGLFLVLCQCGLVIAGVVLFRQYQALADDEPDVALTPNKEAITFFTMGGEALKLDLYFDHWLK